MISNTLEMYPLLRVKAKEHEQIQEKLVQKYNQLLQPEPTLYDHNYDDFINSIKTSLFFESWIDEQDEDFLLETYGIRPGEIHTKLEIADWLLYSTAEIAKLLQFQPLLKEINKLRIRVKHGAKEELLPLLKLKNIGRKRARKLHHNKIKDIKDLNNTSLTLLSHLLGPKIAQDIKQQLEDPKKPIKKGTRKGQLAIPKFK
jgi:helicase